MEMVIRNRPTQEQALEMCEQILGAYSDTDYFLQNEVEYCYQQLKLGRELESGELWNLFHIWDDPDVPKKTEP